MVQNHRKNFTRGGGGGKRAPVNFRGGREARKISPGKRLLIQGTELEGRGMMMFGKRGRALKVRKEKKGEGEGGHKPRIKPSAKRVLLLLELLSPHRQRWTKEEGETTGRRGSSKKKAPFRKKI